ncbi:MAG: hypothetical protein UV39_C0003G0009 [Candidatus Azambacteria bacterium GW2011_GWA2_42_62]|nr:MAG: hypothetical protein UV39_C0003G0009 [Candidatus Azambacteria bacterium GW2011_GWA2_42_62]
MTKNKKIPQKMRWLFWSYDIKTINFDRDKDYVISQGFEKVLNFWTTIFNIRLKKDVREKAIFNINPH